MESVSHDVREPDDLLTADEVAAMLRMKRAWVYAETRRGSLPHVRLGRYVRYRRSAEPLLPDRGLRSDVE